MLEVLCGNKSVQKILIFLFVNEHCYGTQLHRLLKTPLTPLQKSLNRLESGGLIMSYYEGKTRLYQFNPAYPLLHELEQLLKKAYTLLPTQQKKDYYVAKEEGNKQRNKLQTSLAFWDKLQTIKQLSFHAKTKSKHDVNWDGKGQGEVILSKEGSNQLIFNERGTWVNKQGIEMAFSNVFRWTLDRSAGVVSLEHLRRGPDQPVFLFHLAPTGKPSSSKQSLASVDSHLCEGDAYFGQIHFDAYTFRLNWRVIGPHKNEEIDYYYS